MTFRRNASMFLEDTCCLCIIAIICIVCLPIDQIGILPFFTLCFLFFAALMPVVHNEYITVDNEGIMCKKKGSIMWEHTWENIVELKRVFRGGRNSLEIITNNGSSGHYFQLVKTARKAISLYCPNDKSNF